MNARGLGATVVATLVGGLAFLAGAISGLAGAISGGGVFAAVTVSAAVTLFSLDSVLATTAAGSLAAGLAALVALLDEDVVWLRTSAPAITVTAITPRGIPNWLTKASFR